MRPRSPGVAQLVLQPLLHRCGSLSLELTHEAAAADRGPPARESSGDTTRATSLSRGRSARLLRRRPWRPPRGCGTVVTARPSARCTGIEGPRTGEVSRALGVMTVRRSRRGVLAAAAATRCRFADSISRLHSEQRSSPAARSSRALGSLRCPLRHRMAQPHRSQRALTASTPGRRRVIVSLNRARPVPYSARSAGQCVGPPRGVRPSIGRQFPALAVGPIPSGWETARDAAGGGIGAQRIDVAMSLSSCSGSANLRGHPMRFRLTRHKLGGLIGANVQPPHRYIDTMRALDPP